MSETVQLAPFICVCLACGKQVSVRLLFQLSSTGESAYRRGYVCGACELNPATKQVRESIQMLR